MWVRLYTVVTNGHLQRFGDNSNIVSIDFFFSRRWNILKINSKNNIQGNPSGLGKVSKLFVLRFHPYGIDTNDS